MSELNDNLKNILKSGKLLDWIPYAQEEADKTVDGQPLAEYLLTNGYPNCWFQASVLDVDPVKLLAYQIVSMGTHDICHSEEIFKSYQYLYYIYLALDHCRCHAQPNTDEIIKNFNLSPLHEEVIRLALTIEVDDNDGYLARDDYVDMSNKEFGWDILDMLDNMKHRKATTEKLEKICDMVKNLSRFDKRAELRELFEELR